MEGSTAAELGINSDKTRYDLCSKVVSSSIKDATIKDLVMVTKFIKLLKSNDTVL